MTEVTSSVVHEVIGRRILEVDQPIIDYIVNVLIDEDFDFGEEGEGAFDALGELLVDSGCVTDSTECRAIHVQLSPIVDLASTVAISLQWARLRNISFKIPSFLLPGYQEILTDPSYASQFVLMTNPHIGNTGVNFDDEESQQCFLAGLVIRSLSISTSNWRCTETLGDYLAKRNIMGIYDVDTRAITRRLRQDGSLIGVLSTEDLKTDEELLEVSCTWDIVGVDLLSGVSCKAPYEWVDKTDTEWDFFFVQKMVKKKLMMMVQKIIFSILLYMLAILVQMHTIYWMRF